ncbi:MAG: hypothetical protein QOE86_281 [Solirubrobacteraceae bacterium]|jgi:general stress protein 26|nr:hypothetical protein [Solirubrobacteraceae bacterium]
MTSPFLDLGLPGAVSPGRLSRQEVEELLELRLIANLATLDAHGGVHLAAMWFRREGDTLLMPTSQHTRKARNLRRRAHAAVTIDQSRNGLDLRGVLVRGAVELVTGEPARALNRSVHLRYVTEAGLADPEVAAYLSGGDDLTIRVHMNEIVTWNLADRPAGRALRASGQVHPLDT